MALCGATVMNPRRVTIVGGGYSGASAAVQLARHCVDALAITIVEPRAELGHGLAYSSLDADHRLNGNPSVHLVDPADPREFERWYLRENLLARDPEALAADGALFFRRHDFGRFVSQALRAHATAHGARSSIRHLRDRAVGASRRGSAFAVATEGGARLETDLLIVATGNAPAPLPRPFGAELARHPAVVEMPFAIERMRAVDPDARVLVLGTGLTALDAITTLLQNGHRGTISAVSRRGLRPRPQRPFVPNADGPTIVDRIEGPLPPFVERCGTHPTGRGLLRAVRSRIRDGAATGETWHAGFDEFRDVLRQVWTRVEDREKRRILRHVRALYDVHRFRAPPQNDAIVRDAEADGRVTFRAARLLSAQAAGGGRAIELRLAPKDTGRVASETFDAVVNCIGLDPSAGVRRNPLLGALVHEGLLTIDPTGLGFAVDARCRAIPARGGASGALRVVGPPTAGSLADPLGAVFIAVQIRDALSDLIARTPGGPAPYNRA